MNYGRFPIVRTSYTFVCAPPPGWTLSLDQGYDDPKFPARDLHLTNDEFELLRDVTQIFTARISTIPKWSVADFVVDAVGRHIPIVSSLGWNIVMDEAMKQDAEFRLGAVRSEYLLLAVMDLLPAFSNILRLHGVEREKILAYLRNEYEERSRFRDIG